MATAASAAAHNPSTKSASPPPKLSPSEFKTYNRMSETMEYYHNAFRSEWNILYTAVSSSTAGRKALSAPLLIRTGLSFISHLTMHHDFEEAYVFPLLAKRMAAFRHARSTVSSASASEGEAGFAILQHRVIHAGLDKLEAYLRECQDGRREMRREEVKAIMDGFGGVLWVHLEEEVRELGAERMREVGWTVEEMRRMPS